MNEMASDDTKKNDPNDTRFGLILTGITALMLVGGAVVNILYLDHPPPYDPVAAAKRFENAFAEPQRGRTSLGVSQAAYAAIRDGMPYETVRDLVGAEGVEIGHTVIDGWHMQTIQWERNGAVLLIMFQSDQVVSKTQHGL